MAITQNFVSAANLSHVLAFLKTGNPDLISGLASEEDRATLHDRFSRALRKRRPEALLAAEAEAARRRDKAKVRVLRPDTLVLGAPAGLSLAQP